MHSGDEVIHAGYRIVVFAGHKHNNSLSGMSRWGETKLSHSPSLEE